MLKTKIKEYQEIKKGISLHYLDTEKFKTTIISILIRTPLNREEVTKTALLAEVMKQGCSSYPSSYEIAKKTEELYGAVFDSYIMKKGEEQILCFYLECLHHTPDGALLFQKGSDFLIQVVTNPLSDGDSFLDGIVEREKKTLEQKIKGRSDDKKEYAQIRCLEEMCEGEPFGIYADGYEEDLKKISGHGLYEHYLYLMQEAPIEIVIAGKVEDENALDRIKKAFSYPRKEKTKWKQEEGKRNRTEKKNIEETMDVLQGKLCMGFRSKGKPIGKEFYSLLVFNEIFGGGASSRLFLNVREKESLCYYINSFLYRFKMILFLQAGIEDKKKDQTVKLIMECLKRLQENLAEEEELENAKASLIKLYQNNGDNQAAAMDFMVTQYLLGTNETIQDFIEQIKQVTLKEVQKAAKDLTLDTIYMLKGK